MKRPVFEDFKDEYTGGIISLLKISEKYSIAQNDYIDYIESQLKEIKNESDALLDLVKQFRARIYQSSLTNMQLIDMVDSIIEIQSIKTVEKGKQNVSEKNTKNLN